jgi:hypothetical protein
MKPTGICSILIDSSNSITERRHYYNRAKMNQLHQKVKWAEAGVRIKPTSIFRFGTHRNLDSALQSLESIILNLSSVRIGGEQITDYG